MTRRPIVEDDTLTAILHFAEAANHCAWRRVREAKAQRVPIQSVLLELLDRPESAFARTEIAFVRLAEQAGIALPEADPVIEEVVQLLLRPVRLKKHAGRWQVQSGRRGEPRLLARPLDFRQAVWRSEHGLETGVSTRRIHGRLEERQSVRIAYWDDELDPIRLIELYLTAGLKLSEERAAHVIQKWIRRVFGLPHTTGHRYGIAALCREFNALFYDGDASPSVQHIQNTRSTVLPLDLLIERMADTLSGTAETGESLRSALGLLLFLGHGHWIRRTWASAVEESLETTEITPGAAPSWQCVSALEPLQYTWFLTRVFGIVPTMPGLRHLFRGGLLPRSGVGRSMAVHAPPGSGKSLFALHLLVDVALAGHLGVYVSLEEPFDVLIDRLVAFALIDPERFDVVEAGSDVRERIAEHRRHDPERGLLVLHSHRPSTDGRSPDDALMAVFDDVIDGAADDFRIRAITIDSVDAAFPRIDSAALQRRDLHELVRRIEENRFLGILLSEEVAIDDNRLDYLADTVVRLGYDEELSTRLIEIEKCRSQYHEAGPHPFRISDARGITVYPRSSTWHATLSRRPRSTLSEHHGIPYPPEFAEALDLHGIREKASTLIHGPVGAGKWSLLLRLLTERAVTFDRMGEYDPKNCEWTPVRSVLLVSFGAPENRFKQTLRRLPALQSRWARVHLKGYRWYSPGDITAAQVLSELAALLERNRRELVPIERIAFTDIESIPDLLPGVAADRQFWPTVQGLVNQEGKTAFYLSNVVNEPFYREMYSNMDYIIRMNPLDAATYGVTLEKHPGAWLVGQRAGVVRASEPTGQHDAPPGEDDERD